MSKSIHDKYPQGQRVRFVDEQVCQFESRRGVLGVVKGTPRNPNLIRVLQDGRKDPETWSPIFWEPVTL